MKDKTNIESWIKKAKKLMSQCPNGYWLFAANGNLHVMLGMRGTCGTLPHGGMDQSLSAGQIAGRGMPGPAVDGGDW